jgi:hypothetical protein
LKPLKKRKGTTKRTSGALAKMVPISIPFMPLIESILGTKMIWTPMRAK